MKVGLFFGSFNPIHNGHLMLAQYFAEFTLLDEVWFMVSPQNPFKQRSNLLDQYKRFALVQDCIKDNPRLRASDIEFSLPIPSYTIDTLSYLSESYEHDFYLIMGSDLLVNFKKWKNYESILEHYHIMVYPRGSKSESTLLDHKNVEMVDAPRFEISSTFIRKAIRNGKSVRHFVPDSILDELQSSIFYKQHGNG